MKKILIATLSLLSYVAYSQPGSISQSVIRSRVNDSTTVNGATASGYGYFLWNNQKAVPSWQFWNGTSLIDWDPAAAGGGGGTWGSITGTLSDQTDLQTALNLKAPLASPTFTGTVTVPTPFTLGATSVTSTGTQLNYLNAATGTTGTTSTNIVFSTSPTLVTPALGTPSALVLTNATGLPGTAVINTPAGTIAATTAQAAINELDAEKATTAYADAKVADAINNGTTTIAPSQNAVFDALDLKDNKFVTDNIQTGNYTLVLSDKDTKAIVMRSVSPQNLTVPPDASVAFPIGTRITVYQDSTGLTTIVAGSDVDFEPSSDVLTSAGEDNVLVLVKKSYNRWRVLNGGGGSFESGTYTPTLTNTTNIAASTAYLCTYSRTDNSVTFSGQIDIDPTSASSSTVLGMSIPIPSGFTTSRQCGGTFSAIASASDVGGIITDATNDRLTLQYICTADVSNHTYSFHVTYQRIP